MVKPFIYLLIVFSAAAAYAQPPARPPVSAEPLSQAVEQLADEQFEVRQQATYRLWSAGEAARPLLEKATASKNAEVRLRARAILERFNYGIYANTPAEVVRLIDRFRGGDFKQRVEALRALAQQGSVDTVLRLLKLEDDPQLQSGVQPQLLEYLRQHGGNDQLLRLAAEAPGEKLQGDITRLVLARYEEGNDFEGIVRLGRQHESPAVRAVVRRWVEGAVTRLVPPLLDQEDFATTEALLELAAVGDVGMRHLAAFWSLRGELDARLAQLDAPPPAAEAAEAAEEQARQARLRVFLLRAHGDLPAARAAAEQLGEPGRELARMLLFEQRACLEAIDFDRRFPRHSQYHNPITETLGFRAAYYRLAGDEAAFARTIGEIEQLGGDDLELRGACAKVLLINAATRQGLELKKTENQLDNFQMLCRQFRYADAFRQAGLGDDRTSRDKWFAEAAGAVRHHSQHSRERLMLALHAAGVLSQLGQRDEAEHVFRNLGEAVRHDGFNSRVQLVCEAELKGGFMDLAFSQAAHVVGKDRSILGTLFPRSHDRAEMWWEYFRQVHRREPYAASLRRIRQLLYRSAGQKEPPVDLNELVAAVEQQAAELSTAQRTRWMFAAGRTCQFWGADELAKRCFAQAAERAAAAALRYADLLAADQDYAEAAQWYRKSWELDRSQPGSLYLAGHALVQAGQAEAGQRMMRLAQLMPLADANMRYQGLAAVLNQRQLKEAAAEQWELVCRHGMWDEEEVLGAASELGYHFSQDDPLRAAELWETMLLSCLQLKFRFTQAEGYIHMPQLVHKTRARGLLAAERWDEALAEIRLCRSICPGDADFVEHTVPALEKAGRVELADELFDASYAVLEQTCRMFPDSARPHNDLAWMSARCNRRLEEALRLAQRALELAPDTAAYIDTLGEVHFRRGDIPAAIRCAERCLELEPDRKFFQEQLARFQQALGDAP